MRPSVDSLLEWLRTSPRTLDWNAIVAYDRPKTNTVLMQEYINRFSTASYFPPFQGEVPTTENEVEWVYDYLMDAPRLSFENSIITAPRARLTMHVLGGAQISIAKEPGRSAAVIRVASFDALQGPRYTVDIDLLYASGSVDSAGKVQLDLGTGANPLLYFGPTANQRTKGGAFIKSKLAGLAPDIKVFVLNEIGSQANQFLQPERFLVLTHAEPGAKMARAANFGEGAVLLFVTMKGETNGTLPARDEDMQFLIPGGDFSATILMGQRFMVRKILFEGCRKLAGVPQLNCTLKGPPEGFADGIIVSGGARTLAGVITAELPHFSKVELQPVGLPLGEAFEFDIDRAQERLVIQWAGSVECPSELTPSGSGFVGGHLGLSWRLTQAFKFRSEGDSGELDLEALTEGKVMQCKVSPGHYAEHPAVADHFGEIATFVESWLTTELETALADFASVVREIDVFRLNSLLFRGANIVHFTRSQDPGDLAMLGELAPSLTHFAITPLEPKTGPGESIQFRTEPAVPGVTWTVQNIPGSTGAPGSIDASGKYQAPAKEQIQGLFIRVRVIATAGQYSSSALVTVLVRHIVVNPFIQVCGASDGSSTETRELAAGSLSGTALTWKVLGASGSTVVPSTVEGGDHTFVAGPRDTSQTVTIDEVAVTDAAGKSDSAWVLVVHKMPNAELRVQQLAADRAQVLIDLGNGPLLPEDAEYYGVVWTVLKGGGTISTKGVYQADPASQFRFAVITGLLPPDRPGFPAYQSWLILPLPLLELPTLMSALERSDAYFDAVPLLGAEQAAKLLTGHA